MTLDAFEAFTKDRSHLEKWELIDGEAIMQASPKTRHQHGGIGARVADDNHNEIIPDVMILPQVGDDMSNWTFDLLVAFEVLSPGSVRRDMVRKPTIYRRMPALMHYFVVAQDQREVTVFARAEGFVRRTLSGAVLQVDELGIAVSIAEIYRGIRLG
jgi:Uma2 family endonuclease